MAGTPRIFADLTALYQGAAQCFIEHAQLAIAARGRFTVSLAGGSTPKKLYQLLASEPYKSQIDWSAVHLFWGDERYIPYNHSDSNYRMIKEALFDHVPIPAENIHGMPVGYIDLEEAAQAYSQELEAFFDGDIRLDLTFLGMGGDGHTASLFPGDPALNVLDRPVAVARPQSQPTPRLTLTYPVLNRSRCIVFFVAGADKATVLAEVIAGGTRYPSQGIIPTDGALFWFIDQLAAAKLLEKA
ncbi:MAG: 6-phosphogluconolactonase [Anaerolineae bacterium]|nr:6-phosphogluconolactonase [Gloeobacterales cyanobacterium ES-bin-313]